VRGVAREPSIVLIDGTDRDEPQVLEEAKMIASQNIRG